MITMTVATVGRIGNEYYPFGDLYTKVLKDNGISFLLEIIGENTIFTFNETDIDEASALFDYARQLLLRGEGYGIC